DRAAVRGALRVAVAGLGRAGRRRHRERHRPHARGRLRGLEARPDRPRGHLCALHHARRDRAVPPPPEVMPVHLPWPSFPLVFYVFWEAMLIPMYLLIGVWGGQRRIYAAVKFFLYTMAGSVLMLVAILSLYQMQKQWSGVASFDLAAFYAMPIPPAQQLWYFLAFAVAFAIKVPMWPVHTWLPDAHVEAPTAG